MNKIFPVGIAFILSMSSPIGNAQSDQKAQPVSVSDDDRVNELQKKMAEAADKGQIGKYNAYKHEAEKILLAPDPSPPKKVVDAQRRNSSPVSSPRTGCITPKTNNGQAKSCEDLFKAARPLDALPPASNASNYSIPAGSSVRSTGGTK